MSTDSLNTCTTMPPPSKPLGVASWVLVVSWLSWSTAAFWYMELRDWRPFEPANAAFESVDAARVEAWYRSEFGNASQSGAPSKATFIHLYNPDCRCNRFVEPHLQRLLGHYQALGVHFVAAPSSAAHANVPFDLPAISARDGALAAAGVKSSPAALIFDANGRLIYYGPYSDSAWCGSTGNLVEPVLDRALTGLATDRRSRASRGCFCGW